MWTRLSLTVAHSAPSASVVDASGCRPVLLTAVAGLCRSFILSMSFNFQFLHVTDFLPGDHIHHLRLSMRTQ
jgi:hypothetical protein